MRSAFALAARNHPRLPTIPGRPDLRPQTVAARTRPATEVASTSAMPPTTVTTTGRDLDRTGDRFSIFAPGSTRGGIAAVRGQDGRWGGAETWRGPHFKDWSGPHSRRGTDNPSPAPPSRPPSGNHRTPCGSKRFAKSGYTRQLGPHRPPRRTSPPLHTGANWSGPPIIEHWHTARDLQADAPTNRTATAHSTIDLLGFAPGLRPRRGARVRPGGRPSSRGFSALVVCSWVGLVFGWWSALPTSLALLVRATLRWLVAALARPSHPPLQASTGPLVAGAPTGLRVPAGRTLRGRPRSASDVGRANHHPKTKPTHEHTTRAGILRRRLGGRVRCGGGRRSLVPSTACWVASDVSVCQASSRSMVSEPPASVPTTAKPSDS